MASTAVLMLSSVEFFKDEALQGVSRSIKQVEWHSTKVFIF